MHMYSCVWVCVHVFVYAYMCLRMCIFVCVCVHMFVYAYMCVGVFGYRYMYLGMHTRVWVCIHVFGYAYMCLGMHTFVCVCTHKHMHMHTFVWVCIHVLVCVSLHCASSNEIFLIFLSTYWKDNTRACAAKEPSFTTKHFKHTCMCVRFACEFVYYDCAFIQERRSYMVTWPCWIELISGIFTVWCV